MVRRVGAPVEGGRPHGPAGAADVVADLGAGPAVVLVHGVGIGARAFDSVRDSLAEDHRVLVVRRRGYGPGRPVPPSASVGEQVADLLAVVDARGVSSATFVGVSGGATLVLALSLARPDLVRAAVVHEPAIGPLAPDLHAELQAAAGRLAATAGPDGVLGFVNRLVGDSAWARLPPWVAAEVENRWEVVRAEVPEFIAFAPSTDALAGLEDVAVVATVGSRSPGCRQLAAKVLEREAGATVQVLAGVRHLPHLEAPDSFATAIRAAEAAAGR
jgi:pimeloyl-ACP methyl ester carboxylesterase